MITYDECRKVLEQDGEVYSENEIKQIADFLWSLAQLSVEQFLNNFNNGNYEASNTNGQG